MCLDTWFFIGDYGRFPQWDGRRKRRILARYYPNTTLSTGFDIIFFWVARMTMMAGTFLPEKMPFKNCVYSRF